LLDPFAYKVLLVLNVVVIHLAVDYITIKYGKDGITAVRNDKSTVGWLKIGKYFYSFYQFLALGAHLTVCDGIAELGFNTHIAIQSSAFLFTLKRKNLINWYVHAFFYSICLFFSTLVIFLNKEWTFVFKILIVFAGRVVFNLDKYFLWGMYIIFMSLPLIDIFMKQMMI